MQSNQDSHQGSNANAGRSLTPKQLKERQQQQLLMPAPMYSSQQAYAASQLGHQRTGHGSGQVEHQDVDDGSVEAHHAPGIPSQQGTGNAGAADGEELEVDLITPSIDNYQPQVVSQTLQRDAAMLNNTQIETQNEELDVYKAECFLDNLSPSTSQEQ